MENNYLDFIDNEDDFKQAVKDGLGQIAFERIEDMKRQMANDFLTSEEEE